MPRDNFPELIRMDNFRPIKKTTISGEIIDQIVAMVRMGRLKAGEKLPSERELGKFFNVGRSSIREALKALETIGITQRAKKGTIVCASRHSYNSFFWFNLRDLWGVNIVDIIPAYRLLKRGDAQKRDDLMARAFSAGIKIVDGR